MRPTQRWEAGLNALPGCIVESRHLDNQRLVATIDVEFDFVPKASKTAHGAHRHPFYPERIDQHGSLRID